MISNFLVPENGFDDELESEDDTSEKTPTPTQLGMTPAQIEQIPKFDEKSLPASLKH